MERGSTTRAHRARYTGVIRHSNHGNTVQWRDLSDLSDQTVMSQQKTCALVCFDCFPYSVYLLFR